MSGCGEASKEEWGSASHKQNELRTQTVLLSQVQIRYEVLDRTVHSTEVRGCFCNWKTGFLVSVKLNIRKIDGIISY